MAKKRSSYEPIRDISCFEFTNLIPNEKAAVRYVEQLRWGGVPVCPHCESENIAHCSKPMPYRCRTCRKHFSVRTNTVMSQSNLPLRMFLYAIYLLTTHRKGIPSRQLARELGITQKSAWFLGHRIRTALKQKRGILSGPVEVDETYIGGKEKNKHESKKLHAGRGTVGKAPVVGARGRECGKVKARPIVNTGHAELEDFVDETVEKGGTVYTDDHKGYTGVSRTRKHGSVKHSAKEYVKGDIHTNSIESFWALLKRGHYGVYHQMSTKHLERYVGRVFNSAKYAIVGYNVQSRKCCRWIVKRYHALQRANK